jgi:hypothetical protein
MTVWRKPVRLSFLTSCSELSVGGRVPDRRQVVVSNVDHLAQQISISTLSPNAPEGFVIMSSVNLVRFRLQQHIRRLFNAQARTTSSTCPLRFVSSARRAPSAACVWSCILPFHDQNFMRVLME